MKSCITFPTTPHLEHAKDSDRLCTTALPLCFLPPPDCAQLEARGTDLAELGHPHPALCPELGPLRPASIPRVRDSQGALQLQAAWPRGSPSWLGWVSRVYSRGMTFLDPGQGYLKEREAEPKLCRASSPHRGPGFPPLESISSGKAYCAVIPVS